MSVLSWARGVVSTLDRELGHSLRAVVAAPLAGLAAPANARAEVDRVLDSAVRHPGAIGHVTSLAEARTTVLLDGFGDIAAVAARLHVHPNTVRYRVRRIEKLLWTSLADPDDRLVLTLGLRATDP